MNKFSLFIVLVDTLVAKSTTDDDNTTLAVKVIKVAIAVDIAR
jgi:hypothetical protein